VAEENFADQRKAGLDLFTEAAQPFHEIVVQRVSDIKTETVDTEFLDPHFYTAEKIINDSWIAEVQLDELKMSFPAFIPETVVIAAVAVKIDDEPVLVWRIPLLFLHIFECPESSSDMVE